MGVFNYLPKPGAAEKRLVFIMVTAIVILRQLFYAPLIGLYCSYIWRLEHLNNNWNVLMTTPLLFLRILAKLAVILKITLITQLWLCILFFICGKIPANSPA